MKDDRVYLTHILDCICRIEEYVTGGQEAFRTSTLIQDGVLRNLQTLGQSVSRLSERLKAAHPAVEWQSIIGFRNVLVHDYLGVNITRVWEIVAQDLPPLKRQIQTLLKALPAAHPD